LRLTFYYVLFWEKQIAKIRACYVFTVAWVALLSWRLKTAAAKAASKGMYVRTVL
jgi:hypothetical protein